MGEKDLTYSEVLQRVSQNIKTLRKAKGLTQEDMAKLGFNPRHFQKLESGRHSVNLMTIYRLSRALKVDIRDFFR